MDGGAIDSGAPDAGSPDADGGAPDGGQPAPDAGIVFLDWRQVRGTPLVPVVEAEHAGSAFALSDEGWAIESGCDAGLCTYAWYGADGGLQRRHVGLSPVATDSYSPDGTKFAAVEVSSSFVCTAMGASLPLVEGTWGLYDAQTGERLVTHGPLVADPGLLQSAFTRYGGVVRRDAFDRTTCDQVESTPLLTSPPYTTPPALAAIPSDASYPPYVEDDTADGQLIVTSRSGLDTPLWLARPTDPASALQLDGNQQLFVQSSGFVHVLGGWPYSRVASVQLPRTRHDTRLPSTEADFTAVVASGRWVVTCTQSIPDGRRCDAFDGRGERPSRRFTVGPPLPVLAGALESAVFQRPDGGFEQLDLVTGATERLDVPATTARVVGSGAGFVLFDQTRAWGLTRGAPFRIGEQLRAVYRGAVQVEQPQSDVVFVVSSNATGSQAFLDVWNVKTGRVARVSDQLFHNPPFNAPFTADTQCAAPGFLRSLGPAAASAAQPGRWIHFTNFVPAAQSKIQIFVMPADLSAPPRRIAELDPDQCSPPLVSPSGRRLWLPVRTFNGVRVVLAPL
jgi:hypothetical protein